MGHLIVVLQTEHHAPVWDVPCGRATTLLQRRVILALIQRPVFQRRHELLWRTAIIAVVTLPPSRRGDEREMVEVVAPDVIEPVAGVIEGSNDPRILRFRLGGD